MTSGSGAPFCHHNWNESPHIELPVGVCRRYLHTSVLEAVLERPTEYDSLRGRLCAKLSGCLRYSRLQSKLTDTLLLLCLSLSPLREREVVPPCLEACFRGG